MKAFIDTSSLFKRYVPTETRAADLRSFLVTVDTITVSPTYLIEMTSICQRLVRDRLLTPKKARALLSEIQQDHQYFDVVVWSPVLESCAIAMTKKYPLKTLDSIQIAAAALSQSDVYVTSDARLHESFKKEFRETVYL